MISTPTLSQGLVFRCRASRASLNNQELDKSTSLPARTNLSNQAVNTKSALGFHSDGTCTEHGSFLQRCCQDARLTYYLPATSWDGITSEMISAVPLSHPLMARDPHSLLRLLGPLRSTVYISCL